MSFLPESPVASTAIAVVSAFVGVLVGPAFARIGVIRDVGQPTALSAIFADAKSESGVIPHRKGPAARAAEPMSDAERIALGVVVIVGLTIAYMSFRVPVLLGISALAFIVAILATVNLVRMSRAGVIAGGLSFLAVVIGLFSSSALGIFNVALLWNPLFGPDVLQRALEGFEGKSGYGGLDAFVFVALQMTGAVTYIFVAAACVAFSATVNIGSMTYNPLNPFAPAIDMAMTYNLRVGGSTLTGVHDKMPRHDVYIGVPYSHWVSVYKSNYHFLPCLFAGPGQDPDLNLGCRQVINIQI